MTTTKGPIERLRAMVDAERMGKGAADILESLRDVQALADALVMFVDACDDAIGAIDAWDMAEGREEKSDARIDALGALATVCNAAEYDIGEADIPEWLIEELTTKQMGG